MLKVALDAMGGDKAPGEIVRGAVMAAEASEGRYSIVLTGPKELVREEIAKAGYKGDLIEVVDAPQLVAMDEHPAAVLKTKPDSGLVKCVALQKAGLVQASVSAGNSGAMMASCMMLLGRIPGVSRPAIAAEVPSMKGPVLMLDCGANVDNKPQQLVDWAHCGAVYAEAVMGKANPRVGLLNIGEEEKKGPELEVEVHQMLKASSLNFVGNVEPGEYLRGGTDVLVTGGFSGNLLLKTMEGVYEVVVRLFGDALSSSKGAGFVEGWNYDKQGGALLIGLQGTGIIAHGRAEAPAIKAALEQAWKFASGEVSRKIAERMAAAQPQAN